MNVIIKITRATVLALAGANTLLLLAASILAQFSTGHKLNIYFNKLHEIHIDQAYFATCLILVTWLLYTEVSQWTIRIKKTE